MKVTFWGVRGSIPSPGPDTVEYGGNTVSVEVLLDNGNRFIFDAGTGIRPLGLALTSARGGHRGKLNLMLGHYHWDHLQGLPFFDPAYNKGWTIDIWGPARADGAPESVLGAQMDGVHFPVQLRELKAELQFHPVPLGRFDVAGARIDTIPTNHPGGGVAYRVTADDAVFVYMTDNELRPPHRALTTPGEFGEFCQHADLLVHDAQYLPHDLLRKRGWGHSTAWQAVDLALDADVRRLALFHHDPERTDPEIDAIVAEARRRIAHSDSPVECFAAVEGTTVDLVAGLRKRSAARGTTRRPPRRR